MLKDLVFSIWESEQCEDFSDTRKMLGLVRCRLCVLGTAECWLLLLLLLLLLLPLVLHQPAVSWSAFFQCLR